MAQNTRNNILVVGGSSGIGLETAKLALSHLPGANVIISSSNKDKLEKAVAEIGASCKTEGHIVDFVVADLSNFDTQHDDVEKLLEAATKRLDGKIDHIVRQHHAVSFVHTDSDGRYGQLVAVLIDRRETNQATQIPYK